MTRRKRWLIYGGIVCIIVAAQWIFLSTIISPHPEVDQPPAEANRVAHPAGFSIIKPGRTKAIVTEASSVAGDQITILPDSGRSRYTPGLYVSRLREPLDRGGLERNGYRPGSFQGQEALIYTGRSGEYDQYRVRTNRGGVWYEITLSLPGENRPSGWTPSPQWQRYLETFVPASAPPTTMPSGAAHDAGTNESGF